MYCWRTKNCKSSFYKAIFWYGKSIGIIYGLVDDNNDNDNNIHALCPQHIRKASATIADSVLAMDEDDVLHWSAGVLPTAVSPSGWKFVSNCFKIL